MGYTMMCIVNSKITRAQALVILELLIVFVVPFSSMPYHYQVRCPFVIYNLVSKRFSVPSCSWALKISCGVTGERTMMILPLFGSWCGIACKSGCFTFFFRHYYLFLFWLLLLYFVLVVYRLVLQHHVPHFHVLHYRAVVCYDEQFNNTKNVT